MTDVHAGDHLTDLFLTHLKIEWHKELKGVGGPITLPTAFGLAKLPASFLTLSNDQIRQIYPHISQKIEELWEKYDAEGPHIFDLNYIETWFAAERQEYIAASERRRQRRIEERDQYNSQISRAYSWWNQLPFWQTMFSSSSTFHVQKAWCEHSGEKKLFEPMDDGSTW